MNRKLLIQAITKFMSGVLFISLFLFIPAGTLNYWNAWLFMGDPFYSHVHCRHYFNGESSRLTPQTSQRQGKRITAAAGDTA